MSEVTKEINKVTGTVIGMAVRLILYGVLLMLLIEGVRKGYEFGHEVFCSTPMEDSPGHDRSFTVAEGESSGGVIGRLEEEGLIRDRLIAVIQQKFYSYEIYPGDYTLNTSMTSKEILQALNVKPDDEDETETEQSRETETTEEEGTTAETVPESEPEVHVQEDATQVEIRINSRDPYEAGQAQDKGART